MNESVESVTAGASLAPSPVKKDAPMPLAVNNENKPNLNRTSKARSRKSQGKKKKGSLPPPGALPLPIYKYPPPPPYMYPPMSIPPPQGAKTGPYPPPPPGSFLTYPPPPPYVMPHPHYPHPPPYPPYAPPYSSSIAQKTGKDKRQKKQSIKKRTSKKQEPTRLPPPPPPPPQHHLGYQPAVFMKQGQKQPAILPTPSHDSKLNETDRQTQEELQSLSSGKKGSPGPKWSKEDDECLRNLVDEVGVGKWADIATKMEGRTETQCMHRWNKYLQPNLVKGPWTEAEDKELVALVEKYGAKKWSTIADHLPGRIGKQCRERWCNHLDPAISKEAWSLEEDRTILQAHITVGNRWAEIAKRLPGR